MLGRFKYDVPSERTVGCKGSRRFILYVAVVVGKYDVTKMERSVVLFLARLFVICL